MEGKKKKLPHTPSRNELLVVQEASTLLHSPFTCPVHSRPVVVLFSLGIEEREPFP